MMGKILFVLLLVVCFYNVYTISFNEGYKVGREEAGDYEEGYQVGYENCEIMQKIIKMNLKDSVMTKLERDRQRNDSIKSAEHGR